MKKNNSKQKKTSNPFNIVLVGVGGQGLITLTRILAETAVIEEMDVKTSELHGLSQRGGSIETHIKFGKKVYSPLVRQGGADLVVALELQEAPRACFFGSQRRTVFLVNNHLVPIVTDKKRVSVEHSPSEFNNFSKRTLFVPATKIVKKQLENPVLTGVFMAGLAVSKDLIPLNSDSLKKAVKKVVPKKYFRINKKALQLAERYRQSS